MLLVEGQRLLGQGLTDGSHSILSHLFKGGEGAMSDTLECDSLLDFIYQLLPPELFFNLSEPRPGGSAQLKNRGGLFSLLFGPESVDRLQSSLCLLLLRFYLVKEVL